MSEDDAELLHAEVMVATTAVIAICMLLRPDGVLLEWLIVPLAGFLMAW